MSPRPLLSSRRISEAKSQLRYSSQDVEGMVSEGYEALAFFCSSQSTGPPSFPRKPTKVKVQVAKGQVPLTFYSHLLLVQRKEGVMGLTSQGVPGEPVLQLELHLGSGLGQGQQQQWEQKDPFLGC